MAKDETFISERQALSILMTQGYYAESQARAILAHSRKIAYNGGDYYPMSYIYKRAKGDAKKNPAPRKRAAKKAVKKTAKRKTIRAKSIKAKRNPSPPARMAREKAPEFVVVVENTTAAPNYFQRYYWTGKLLDTDKSKAKIFKYHDDAARAARGVAVRAPKAVAGIWVERA